MSTLLQRIRSGGVLLSDGATGTYLQAGANIVGGCCGTSPDHVRAFAKVLRD